VTSPRLTRFWLHLSSNGFGEPYVRIEWTIGGKIEQAVAIVHGLDAHWGRCLAEYGPRLQRLMGDVPASIEGDVVAAVVAVIMLDRDDVEGWQGFETEADQAAAIEAFYATREAA
jgi:hypothetical protein